MIHIWDMNIFTILKKKDKSKNKNKSKNAMYIT